jgi:quercetin 2,3-dioxygenase
MKILHRDLLPRGGFAGLKETRLVANHETGSHKHTWNGIGNFVYLADARYLPYGETRMHSHREVDVITVMLEGRLTHEGSLEDGQSMQANQVQVQRAGGEGFSHNEVNPDQSRSRLLQLWALPETAGEPADYKFYDLKKNQLMRIYGGNKSQPETFDSHTIIEVGLLKKNKTIIKDGQYLAYVTNGEADIDGTTVKDGDLISGENLNFIVTSDVLHLTLITVD